MIGIRRETPVVTGGFGRLVEPNSHLLQPQLHECARAVLSEDDRTVCLSYVRSSSRALHSVSVDYKPDAVRLAIRLGTRPGVVSQLGCPVLRMVVEHTAVRLREPLRGRRLDVDQPGSPVSRSS